MSKIREEDIIVSYNAYNYAIVTHIPSKMIFIGCGHAEKVKNRDVALHAMNLLKVDLNSRKLEIEIHDTWKENKARLTITSNRITLKINKHLKEEMKKRLSDFSLFIAEDLKNKFINSLRGDFCFSLRNDELKITMYNNGKKIRFSYKEGDMKNEIQATN